jgi:hypothetical protein
MLALAVHPWRRTPPIVCCAFPSAPRIAESATDAPSAALNGEQIRPGDAIDPLGDGFADAKPMDTAGDGRADTHLDPLTRAGLAALSSLVRERGPIIFNGVRGQATAESPAGITQAWSLDHSDEATRESNWRTIMDLACILVASPLIVCELRGGTTESQSCAPEQLAQALNLDAEREADLIMEELAYLRSAACRAALIDRGVDAGQLRVTADGRNRGMQVDIIVPAAALPGGGYLQDGALAPDKPGPPSAPTMAATVAPGDVVDTGGSTARDRVNTGGGTDGTLVDTDGGTASNALFVDMRRDGQAGTIEPVFDALPWQAEANRFFSSPGFELYSVVATVALLLTFAMDQQPTSPHSWSPPPDAWTAENSPGPWPSQNSPIQPGAWASNLGAAARALLPAGFLLPSTRDMEWTISAAFGLEFIGRWWAAGLRPKFLASPYSLLDLLNLLPSALDLASLFSSADSLGGPLAPLRLLRAARILRLRRYFEPESFERFAAAILGGAASEVQRVVARTFFSVLCIVLISAGVELQLEGGVNPGFSSYLDAIYFSVTTLTTVGFG